MSINFFFDVDGTILPFGKDIPESALKAIYKARDMGHRIFLSTGRGTMEIDSRLDKLPLDGGVYSAGGTVIFKDRIVYTRRFDEEEKAYMLDFAKENNLEILIQTEKGTFMKPSAYRCWEESLMKYVGRMIAIPNLIVVDEFPDDLVVNKLDFFSMDGKVETIRKIIDKRFTVVGNTVGLPLSMMAEIALSDITKATGIKAMIDYLGDDLSSVVAVGDGANDFEMVEYASLGIAMGNASDELKSVADFVTTDIEEDGLANAIAYAIELKG